MARVSVGGDELRGVAEASSGATTATLDELVRTAEELAARAGRLVEAMRWGRAPR